MPNILTQSLKGTLKVVSHDGRSGVVALDQTHLGLPYAVINPDTRGRVAMMSAAKDGRLQAGKRVVVEKAEKGSEALIALKVSYA